MCICGSMEDSPSAYTTNTPWYTGTFLLAQFLVPIPTVFILHPCLLPPLISHMDKGYVYNGLQGERILKHSELLLRDVVLVMPESSDWFTTLSRTITHCHVRART